MKKLLCLLLCLCFALVLTGCHGRQQHAAFEVPSAFDTSKEYNIVFWAKNDTNKTQVDIYNKAIADFEAVYPNIHVTIKLYTDYGKIYADVITNTPTNTTPNVCITYPDHIATYITGAETVVTLDKLMTDEKFGLGGSEVRFDAPAVSEIVPQFLAEGIIDGHYYALPYMRSTEACFVNKTYVEKLGFTLPEKLTWDFVWEVSEAAMAKDESGNFIVNGQKTMIPFIYKSTDNMMIQMLKQLGAEYSTETGDILIFNDTTASLLTEIYTHAQSRAFSTFSISSYPANFLDAGQCLFAIDSTAGATWMGSKAPLSDIADDARVEFETAVMAIPQFDTANPVMISQGPSLCVFNKDDPGEVLASWLFAQFMLTNSVQISYAETEGYVPVTTKAQNDAAYTDYLAREGEDGNEHYAIKIQASKLLLNNTGNTFVTPVFNGSAKLRNAAGQLIENVTKSARRNQGLDIPKVYADTAKLYDLSTGVEESGLPTGSKLLLAGLAVIWVIIGISEACAFIKRRKKVR